MRKQSWCLVAVVAVIGAAISLAMDYLLGLWGLFISVPLCGLLGYLLGGKIADIEFGNSRFE